MPSPQRREQLLDATLGLIATNGYAGVSMEAVARAAGVSKPVVYDLFPDRGALLRALLDREEGRALATLATVTPAAPDPGADPDDLLVEGVIGFLRAVAANPTPWRLILTPVEGTPRAAREHVEAGRRAFAAQLEQLVDWGVRARGGPVGVDVELAAQAILALGEQSARLVLDDPERFDPDRVGRFVRGLLRAVGR
jgi:AcrR family transcriptional regulator